MSSQHFERGAMLSNLHELSQFILSRILRLKVYLVFREKQTGAQSSLWSWDLTPKSTEIPKLLVKCKSATLLMWDI